MLLREALKPIWADAARGKPTWVRKVSSARPTTRFGPEIIVLPRR